MLPDDIYRTIDGVATGIYKEKGSRFLCFAEPVKTEPEVKAVLQKYRKLYHAARHHCYAYALGPAREVQRVNDDGEPPGTAGRPIFGQILSFGLTDIVVIVIRYFGGIKLGVSGLIRAYKSAAGNALKSAGVVEKTIDEIYEVVYQYPETSEVMRIVKEKGLQIRETGYTDVCRLVFAVRKKNAEDARESMSTINNITINYLRSG